MDMPKHSKWLTDDEKRFLILRKEVADGGRKSQAREEKFSWKVLMSVLADWKIPLQAIVALSNTIPNYGLKFTMPSITKSMGFTSSQAQLMTIPPYVVGAAAALAF